MASREEVFWNTSKSSCRRQDGKLNPRSCGRSNGQLLQKGRRGRNFRCGRSNGEEGGPREGAVHCTALGLVGILSKALNGHMPRNWSSSEAPINQLKAEIFTHDQTTVTQHCSVLHVLQKLWKTVLGHLQWCDTVDLGKFLNALTFLSLCGWHQPTKTHPFNLLSLTSIKAKGQCDPSKSIWLDFKVWNFSWNCETVHYALWS